MAKNLSGHSHIGEPRLLFGSGQDVHPLRGLANQGPADRGYYKKTSIRLATINVGGDNGIERLLNMIEQKHSPKEREDYLLEFPGFRALFGMDIKVSADFSLDQSLIQSLTESSKPADLLLERLIDAITAVKLRRSDFDILLIYLPKTYEPYLKAFPTDRRLHDILKGICAEAFIPLQIIREKSALEYSCKASVMWRLSIALYTKAGGVPWKIANHDKGKAFIGISYAMRPSSTGTEYVTCCSQMFDPDGTGFEFVAYDVEECERIKENPFLTRDEMFKVMSRSLALYQDRHNGNAPKKITVHKQTHFTDDEIEGCFEAFPDGTDIELVQITQSPWLGVRIPSSLSGKTSDEVKKALGFPVDRGSYLPISSSECLLWIQGNISGKQVSKFPNYYKEQIRIPRPVMLKRFAGTHGWHETCLAIIGLSKMDWNNDAIYDQLPVTLSYSNTLADVIKHMPSLARQTYQYRLFM